MDIEKADDTLKILGVALNSTELVEVLSEAGKSIRRRRKFFIVTPNPEFLVLAQADKEFKKILNSADLAIPDGFGLILASRFLGTKPVLRQKLAGADLTAALLDKARTIGWQVGIVGARKGEIDQQKLLVDRLEQRYPGLKVECLEQAPDRQRDLIFACQGMGEQEKWIAGNIARTRAWVFVGVGGSLDFLTGFSRRAPLVWRNLGLEWLWRLLQNPRRHFKRVFRATVIFSWLVWQEKLNRLRGNA